MTTLPVASNGRIWLSTNHSRPGQLFTLFCVAGGPLAARPVVLEAAGTSRFGAHGGGAITFGVVLKSLVPYTIASRLWNPQTQCFCVLAAPRTAQCFREQYDALRAGGDGQPAAA